MPVSVRRTAPSLLIALALVALTMPARAPADAHERSFRLIAMDMRQDLGDAQSYATYRAHLAERIRRASDAFASDRPNLVFLPEDAGLMAWLVGPRGVTSREAPDSVSAIASLGGPYAPQVQYYATKCPGISPARALVLALTDTAWRAFVEPLAALARDHGTWIVASLNAPDVQVVRDPAKVALLGDPAEVVRGYAYEGGCDVYNKSIVFPPDASLDRDGAADPTRATFATQRKAYLVPIERTQDLGLGMTGEDMAHMRPIDTGFARLGILTSKDAWMPDVAERLDDLGMEVWLQPEAGPWAAGTARDWPADAMHRAMWGQVQRLPSTRYGALSNLTGNFFDLFFDGTATITKDSAPGDAPQHLLGRLPQTGFVARAPWIAADPPEGVAIDDWNARRSALAAINAKVMPGSGDALENGQLEELVWADIFLPERAAGPHLSSIGARSSVVARTDAPQWAPSLAAQPDGSFSVAWTDLRNGNELPAVRTLDAGSVQLAETARRPYDQQGNRYDTKVVALPDGSLQALWTDFANQSWSIYGTHTIGATGDFEGALLVDDSPTSDDASAEGFPNEQLHQDPALAVSQAGTLYAAWADVRGRRVPWRVAVARSTDGGHRWIGHTRADGGGPLETTRAQLDHVDPAAPADQFAPAIAVAPSGIVWVAWQDHATGRARVMVSRSTDGARTFSTPVAVDPVVEGDQYRPSIAISHSGDVAVAWEDSRSGDRRVMLAVAAGEGTFAPAFAVDAPAPAGAQQARAAVAYLEDHPVVVWQDDRAGDWDVALAVPGLLGPVRIDDGPDGADARLPALAIAGERVAVAWEDARLGYEQIHVARFAL